MSGLSDSNRPNASCQRFPATDYFSRIVLILIAFEDKVLLGLI